MYPVTVWYRELVTETVQQEKARPKLQATNNQSHSADRLHFRSTRARQTRPRRSTRTFKTVHATVDYHFELGTWAKSKANISSHCNALSSSSPHNLHFPTLRTSTLVHGLSLCRHITGNGKAQVTNQKSKHRLDALQATYTCAMALSCQVTSNRVVEWDPARHTTGDRTAQQKQM